MACMFYLGFLGERTVMPVKPRSLTRMSEDVSYLTSWAILILINGLLSLLNRVL